MGTWAPAHFSVGVWLSALPGCYLSITVTTGKSLLLPTSLCTPHKHSWDMQQARLWGWYPPPPISLPPASVGLLSFQAEDALQREVSASCGLHQKLHTNPHAVPALAVTQRVLPQGMLSCGSMGPQLECREPSF